MDAIMINHVSLVPKTFNGQRVVTFKDIDAVHERPEGTARRNFNQNKQYFIEGEDFYCVNQGNLSMYENRTLENIPPKGITVFSQTGYLMLVKSFHDALAWRVQRQLVNVYFKAIEMAEQNVQPNLAQNYIQIPLPDYSVLLARVDSLESALRMQSSEQFSQSESRMEALERRMDDFTLNMTNLSRFIVDKMEKFDMRQKPELVAPVVTVDQPFYSDDRKSWKRKVYKLMDDILLHDHKFSERADIYKYLYKLMRNEDGAVWEQYIKEYKAKYDMDAKPATIDVCYEDKTLRSIFMAKLENLAFNCGAIDNSYIIDAPLCLVGDVMPEEVKHLSLDRKEIVPASEIIRPLIELRQDVSVHGVISYKKVYQYMTDRYGVSWKHNETRYITKNGRKPSGRIAVVMDNPRLYRKFKNAVNDLINLTVAEDNRNLKQKDVNADDE